MRKVPYSPPKCTVCAGLATVFASSKEPRCVRHQAAAPKTKKCGKCGSLMMVRENKNNHSFFWGCTNYPKCFNAVNI